MSPITILWIIISFYVFEFLVHLILSKVNKKHWKKDLPNIIKNYIDEEKYQKSMSYDFEKRKLSLISETISFIIILITLITGLFGKIDYFLRNYTENKYFLPLLYFGTLSFISFIYSLPFNIYSTFVIEEKYGFNKYKIKTYILDILKEIFLSLFIGGGLGLLLLWIYFEIKEYFWIFTWFILTLFSLALNMFYSNLIVPLFYKQKPLQEGLLKDKILKFVEKINFPIKNIYIINGSLRTTKANAYFTGIGPKKRIVLYDTLLEQMNEDEIVAVLAHEIGHYKKRHTIWSFISFSIISLIMMYVFSLFAENKLVCQALGSSTPSIHVSLIGFSLLFSPLMLILSVIANYFSRKNELKADDFAKNNNLGEHLATALIKLHKNNLSNLLPHPAYVWFYYSHPPLLKRLENLKS